MNRLVKELTEVSNETKTENGAKAYNSLSSSCLQLFATIGSLRPRAKREIESLFESAFNENQELAVKMLFYAGDIRSGLGERRTFRICLRWLAFNYPSIVRLNMMFIPYFNRFDSWYELVGTPVEKDMWRAMRAVYQSDRINLMDGESISLLAKWMKSINASSPKTRELGFKTMRALDFKDEKTYRKTLSLLRGRIRVVEKTMSANKWDGIEYSIVPSYAMKKYMRAFSRHDQERFADYLENVSKGEDTINSSVMYPYDLVEPLVRKSFNSWWIGEESEVEEKVLDLQWKALPDYLNGDDSNIICMADVSESMHGRPMASSVGLAIYFAERNKGEFKNLYMTFSDKPSFIKVNPNDSLTTKVMKVVNTGVGYNTNLEAAFDFLLEKARITGCSKEEMPKALIIISDNEIDSFNNDNKAYNYPYFRRQDYNLNFIEEMKKRYEAAGYDLPKIIFWQVESRQDTFLAKSEQALWVSGQSASTFKNLINAINKTPYELMCDTLNDERYSCIEIEKAN